MIFENNTITGEGSSNNPQPAEWVGKYSNEIIIDNAGQGFGTYNCLQCENEVYFINGDSTRKGAVTSNKVIADRQDYRYGNYFKKGETCTQNCVTGCFNTVVANVDNARLYWVYYAAGTYIKDRSTYSAPCEQTFVNETVRNLIVCKDSNVSKTWELIPWVKCLASTAGSMDIYNIEIKSDYGFAVNGTIGPCPTQLVGQGPNTAGWPKIPVPKHLYKCYQVVSCPNGVTPVTSTEFGTLYRITQDGYTFDDPTFYLSVGTGVTCTNYNDASTGCTGMASYSYTSVGTGYCENCFGCNSGCTIACVGCYSSTVWTSS